MASWRIVRVPESTYVTDPVTPCGGQPFTVTWHEINVGTDPSDPYTDVFQMNIASGNIDTSVDNDALDPNQPVERSATVTVAPGTYLMNLFIAGDSGEFLGNIIVEDCS